MYRHTSFRNRRQKSSTEEFIVWVRDDAKESCHDL
jgi:hypothetical protein